MFFSSIDFALFSPIVFILYLFIINKFLKLHNVLVMLASYVFYGDKAVGIKRGNDFRASVSVRQDRNPKVIDVKMIYISNFSCLGFDFILDKNFVIKIVESSCVFASCLYRYYWDKDLDFHEGEFNLQYEITEDFIKFKSI